MSDIVTAPDTAQRERALDPSRSFIVQAPAGSGKTELLIQRFLALLGRVDRPEEIAAITFTIKAAAEMRHRVFAALADARAKPRPQAPHEARTWDLARAALERNDERGWKLEESADRLRVQTIDALCASLTRQMPVLSRFGGQPQIVEDASLLYAEAARNLLAALDIEGHPAAQPVARLLSHLDNDSDNAEKLLAAMLEKRDHWIRTLARASDRRSLEAALGQVRLAAVAEAHRLWPAAVRAPRVDDVEAWVRHAGAYLTSDGKWRARPATDEMRANHALRAALRTVKALPPPRYDEAQWDALQAIIDLLPLAVAELRVVFAQHGTADFIEIAQGALRALEGDEGPTDLLLVLDYRIRHMLVDEFQDTSHSQYELLQKLTSGWEPGDGRTLFVVGDPMQSIYRFREAEVGLFLRAQHEGIGSVKLEPLTLSANFRSQAGIVEWVNAAFATIMPAEEDIPGGAVTYSPSQAVHAAEDAAVRVHAFFDGDSAGEARQVAKIARDALEEQGRDPSRPATVAILVRNRSHLAQVMPCLRDAGLKFRAVEIESLGHRPAVQDLLALTRALSHPADRIAWLAVLRAPWCGLTLADLLVLGADATRTVWESACDEAGIAALSPDGRARLARTRDILARSLAERRRSSLRDAVEGAWLALGGPACVESDTDLEDAEIYLDHLEDCDEGGTIADMAAFEESVAKLYALPDLRATDRLQVMTIHKAKGLEFDTVIVPGLGAGTLRDDRKLFMWMETPDSSLLLAPINSTGSDEDLVFELIRGLDKRKADHENGRLLYVAATRARRRLHLIGDAKRDHAGVAKAAKGSLLAKLWCVVAPEFGVPGVKRPAAQPAPVVAPSRQGMLRRLAIDNLRYDAPAPVAWTAPPDARPYDEIEFSWVGDTARRVGSVVHRWLQRIAEDEARGWDRRRIEGERGAIASALTARGVAEGELEPACERVVLALASSLEDAKGRWLVGPQRNARNEYRISTVIDGVRHRLVIDRMFDDAEGRAWIVDYKTSSHEGGELERFLAAEEERYRAQVERYAAAVKRADARRGLYFPLLKGWREWGAS